MGYSILPPVRISPEQSFRKGILAVAILVELALVTVWTYPLPWQRVWNGENDFLSFYAGGKLVGSPDLYSPEAAAKVQSEVTGLVVPAERYIRLPFWALFLKPLSWLPYRIAWAAFGVINLTALILVLVIFAKNRVVLWLWGGVSIPIVATIANGQDIFLMLLVCGAGVLFIRRGWLFPGGVILALALAKFHLFLMLPVMLIARRQWRVLAGGATGCLILLTISTWTQGLGWLREYISVLRAPEINPAPYTFPNLAGMIQATLGRNTAIEIAIAILATAVVAFAAATAKSLEHAFAIAVLGGLFTSHHAYIQDCSVLLLASALVQDDRRLRVTTLALMSAPFYFLLDAGVFGIALPLCLAAWIAWAAFHTGERAGAAQSIR